MWRLNVRAIVVIAVVAAFAGTVVLGSKNGVDAGFSGGRVGGGNNCTSCHPFNLGTGRVDIVGVPLRYRPGRTYDVTVRIVDAELEPDPLDGFKRDGAGFELSAESASGHAGLLEPDDPSLSQYASAANDYVTHTRDGLNDSIDQWVAGGGSYEYHIRWHAPETDEGPVTLFAAVNTVPDPGSFGDVHFYGNFATTRFAMPGDFDDDGDIDVEDHEGLVSCLGLGAAPDSPCEPVDVDGDADVDLADVADFFVAFSGAVSTAPPGYATADAVRGGLIYDEWWSVSGMAEPVGDHPLYPGAGQQSGPATFRCKECHGWDYEGAAGAYATGSHYTGIVGVLGTSLTPQEMFDLLKADPGVVPGGHDMDAYGMSDRDIWDVVRMVGEAAIDTSPYIDGTGAFTGDAFLGGFAYDAMCALCHGYDGADPQFAEPLGPLADANPWEFLHKVRFGHPATGMPAYELLGRSVSQAADVGARAQQLP